MITQRNVTEEPKYEVLSGTHRVVAAIQSQSYKGDTIPALVTIGAFSKWKEGIQFCKSLDFKKKNEP